MIKMAVWDEPIQLTVIYSKAMLPRANLPRKRSAKVYHLPLQTSVHKLVL